MKVELGPYPKKGRRSVRIRIHKYDTWCLDHTLSLIILPLMKKFNKKGVPGCMFDGNSFEISDEEGKRAEDKWNSIIDKIIWSMHEIAYNGPNEPEFPKGSWVIEDQDNYRTSIKEYERRVDEGCELLGKYFRCFWS